MTCARTRSSRSRRTSSHPIAISLASRHSAPGEYARCALAAAYGTGPSSCTAPRSDRCPSRSCSTSTTPSMPFTATSSCACSMPTTTIRLPAHGRVRRRGKVHHGRVRPARRPKGTEIGAHLRRLIRAIRGHWPTTRIDPGRQPLLWSAGDRLVPHQWHRLHSRRGDDRTSPAHCGPGGYRQGAFPGSLQGKVRRFTEFLDGVSRWSRVERIIAVLRPASRAATRGSSSPISPAASQNALRADLLSARHGGKSHQGLESPPGGRPHVLPPSDGEPVPAVHAAPIG